MKWKLIFQYVLMVFCFFAACQISQKAQTPMTSEFDKQGHRGCRGLMPENTIPAMVRALELNVTTLEMDVVVTRDKKVVLSHEPWFNAMITTLPDGSSIPASDAMKHNIYQMDYSQVKSYDVGMKKHPAFPLQQKIPAYKPLLGEVMDTIRKEMTTRKRPFPKFNIEIKSLPAGDDIFHPKPTEFVDLVMQVVEDQGMAGEVIIQSFDTRILKYVHEKYPAIPVALLIEGNNMRGPEEHLAELGFTPSIYSPSFTLVSKELVKRCHELRMKVIPWTINDKTKINELKEMGVNGIITDFPDLFD